MNRIDQTRKALIDKSKVVNDSIAWLNFTDFFTPEIESYRKELRKVLEEKVAGLIPEMVEKAEFPDKAIPILREMKVGEKYCGAPYGKGKNLRFLYAIILELARIDAGLATMVLVQLILLGNTIDDFGSEEQKAKLLPKILNFEIIGGWGLTERDIGSDASNLKTTCRQLENGNWVINGNKRWIGNANKDIMVVFARDEKSKQVKGFIVSLTSKGITRNAIKNKMALRPVQNMDIQFENVEVEEQWRLPKVVDFSSVAKMLAHSRICVAMLACGAGIGIYDNVVKYLANRGQFNKSLLSFQLIQEKLVRIMGNVQASLSLVGKLVELGEKGQNTIGKYAMAKAWVTLRIRESAALAREMMGGNGIIHDNYAIKAMMDMEAIYTYEGTYDINSLVAGRELTGLAAFK
jgi:acyl-CoA oxidase